MKKFIHMIAAIIIMAANSNVFAQQINPNSLAAKRAYYKALADKKLIASVADGLYAEDCMSCDFPASIQRSKIIKALQDYKDFLGWDCSDPNIGNLRSEFLEKSEVVYGRDVKGTLIGWRVRAQGPGYEPFDYKPNEQDTFFAFQKQVYLKVGGTPKAPKAFPTVLHDPFVEDQGPVIAQDPHISAPLPPAPTPTVASTPVAPTAGCTTIVYVNASGGHSCSGGGCSNYGCVDLAARVYPINYFEPPTPPRRPYGSCNNSSYYGNNYYGGSYSNCGYGSGGVGISMGASVYWNGGYYYPYDNYWYCKNNGQRVCAEDYKFLCNKYGSPTVQQNTNTYNGPHTSTISSASGSGVIFSHPR